MRHCSLFHGMLWRAHRTHHEPGHRSSEVSDLFPRGFAEASMAMMWAGRADPLVSTAFPLGLGVAVYGLLSFVLHDVYAHYCFLPFQTRNAAAQAIKRAQGRRHQSLTREGQEPYGLFLFPPRYGRRFRRARDSQG